jgi:competence protein ComEC
MGKNMRRTTVLCWGLVSFLVGLVLARRVMVDTWAIIPCVVLAPLLWRGNLLSLLSIGVIGVLIGCWRGSVYMQKLLPYRQLTKQAVIIRAVAKTDAVYGDKSQLEFEVEHITILEPYQQSLVGTIGIKGFGEAMIYRGDILEISAKLYPTRGAKQASLSFAQIKRLQTDTSYVNKLRRHFAARVQSVLPEPLGSFGLGLLIGQRNTLPDSLNEQLTAVGLTHLVAVSGYNLTIIMHFVQRLLKKRSKYQAALFAAALIGLFVMIVGTSASIIRAALVSGLSILAWYYGRTFKPLVLILLVAGLTAGWFPPYIWSDVGWYLSFLAFCGVLVLSPLLLQRFWRQPPKSVTQMLIETVAAQVLTLPLIMYVFGRLSLIALLANLLIVPLVPLAMSVSFGAGLMGMGLPFMAGWFAWPATILMTYIVDLIRLLSQLPRASVGLQIDARQLSGCYVLVLMIVWLLWKKVSPNGKLTDRIQRVKTGET